ALHFFHALLHDAGLLHHFLNIHGLSFSGVSASILTEISVPGNRRRTSATTGCLTAWSRSPCCPACFCCASVGAPGSLPTITFQRAPVRRDKASRSSPTNSLRASGSTRMSSLPF